MFRRSAVLMVALLMGLVVLPAGAHVQSKKDPQDVSAAMPLDIKKVTFDHTSKTFITKHTMWKAAFGVSGDVVLWIHVGKKLYRADAFYEDDAWIVPVFEVSGDEVYVGDGTVKKLSETTLKITVPRKLIGALKSEKIKWSVSTQYIEGDCAESGCFDWLPDDGGWFSHEL